jgi:DNA processing protein
MESRTITRSEASYPRLLGEIADPPKRLYISGRALDQAPYIAVVGTRKATAYGLDVARRLASELTEAGLVVVSGLARGIDAAAHEGALAAKGTTVAVLGCGLDVCYPRRNMALYRRIAAEGTLVSEYELGTGPRSHHFPHRNRIIAGMSLGVVVVEGRRDGGAMITARLAMESGREVFAIPGPAYSVASEGPHALICDGARLITGAGDVIEELGLLRPPPSGTPTGPSGPTELTGANLEPLNPDEAAVLRALGHQPELLDKVASVCGRPAAAVAAVLARLEVDGLVLRHAGGRFSLSASGTEAQ